MPPPNCLPAVPLPSTRGAAALRQRPVPARGGQLQIAGVVVGSWGPNFGNVRQTQLVGGFPGRGRGGINFGGQYNNPRGRGQQRKPGPPAFPVNKKNNVSIIFRFCFFFFYMYYIFTKSALKIHLYFKILLKLGLFQC